MFTRDWAILTPVSAQRLITLSRKTVSAKQNKKLTTTSKQTLAPPFGRLLTEPNNSGHQDYKHPSHITIPCSPTSQGWSQGCLPLVPPQLTCLVLSLCRPLFLRGKHSSLLYPPLFWFTQQRQGLRHPALGQKEGGKEDTTTY